MLLSRWVCSCFRYTLPDCESLTVSEFLARRDHSPMPSSSTLRLSSDFRECRVPFALFSQPNNRIVTPAVALLSLL
jgi:hypothetical protein